RLLQCLQERIERVRREHVHLVDQVHLVAAAGGRVLHVVEQLTRIVDLGARGRIDLDEIDEAPGIDLTAGRALAAWRRGDAGLAVEAFRENERDGGLAHSPGTGEEEGVVDTAGVERVHERPTHVVLPDQLGEGPRPPLARQRGVGFSHWLALNWRRPASAKAPAPDIAAAAAAFRP